MSLFLSLHALAAARGDGLRPEFVDLFKRLAVGTDVALSASAEPPAGCAVEPAKAAAPQKSLGADRPTSGKNPRRVSESA